MTLKVVSTTSQNSDNAEHVIKAVIPGEAKSVSTPEIEQYYDNSQVDAGLSNTFHSLSA